MGMEFPAEKRFLIKLMTPAHGIPCGGLSAFLFLHPAVRRVFLCSTPQTKENVMTETFTGGIL